MKGRRGCTGIADKMARLACYDAAFGANAVPPPHSFPPSASQAPPAAAPLLIPKTPDDAFGDTGNLKAIQHQRHYFSHDVGQLRYFAHGLGALRLGQANSVEPHSSLDYVGRFLGLTPRIRRCHRVCR